MQLRQRSAAMIGLLIVLLFYPAIAATSGSGFPLETMIWAQSLCYLASLTLFLYDRDGSAGSVLQGIAFALVGFMVAIGVIFLIGMAGIGSSGF